MTNVPTKVFISYSHRDSRWLKRLQVHLKPLVREGAVELWDDTKIRPGADWRSEISHALASAHVAILLVSADFLSSDFIARNELPPLLEKAGLENARVLSLIVGPCLYSKHEALSRYQAINPPSKPLSSLNKSDAEAVLVRVAMAVAEHAVRPRAAANECDSAPITTSLTRRSLRILYFQARPRSSGLDCWNAERLLDELRRRGHDVRLCWAVHEPLTRDTIGVSEDIVHPDKVREWRPHVLVFEDDFFVGDPKIPEALLDELELAGSVAVIELSASKIWSAYCNRYADRTRQYEEFLASRGLQLQLADRPDVDEHPKCVSDISDSTYVETSVDELRQYSCIKDEQLFVGVQRIGVSWAVPLKHPLNALITAGRGARVKAYNSECHRDVFPVYGALNDRKGRTEAIFTGMLMSDHTGSEEVSFDNHIYVANLIEVLHRRRSKLRETGW